MRQPYLGICWTLPVNWAGFRDLPPSVEAAAAGSKTIRYQCERVRRHVEDVCGDWIAEIAFMDSRTSDLWMGRVDPARAGCRPLPALRYSS